MRASALFIALLAKLTFLTATCAYAREARSPGEALAPANCTSVELTGNQAVCTPLRCTLTGHARLVCGDLQMQADALTVDADLKHNFVRAGAQGNVQLRQAGVCIDADALVLNQDRLSGRVEGATLRLLREPEALLSRGAGTSALIAHGTLERETTGGVILTDADVTLCDCGDACPPTWRLMAPQVRITGDRRALIFWPRLEISLARRWMLPITPPLFFISLPLTRRAAGFLPPKLRFYGAARPTVDLPFFIPLGPHADLTVTPGLRTDWAESHSVNFLGAPRLGARLRYAPLEGTWGEMAVAATYDGRKRKNRPVTPAARLRFDLRHESTIGPDQEVTLVARWLSDARYLKDFGVRPTERVSPYIPSRGQWVRRHPRWVTSLSIDALMPLRQDGTPIAGETNAIGEMPPRSRTLHRLPAWRAAYLPRGPGARWFKGQILQPTGEVYAARYARLASGRVRDADEETLSVLGALVGGQTVGLLGPLATRAHLGLDLLGIAAEDAPFTGGISGRAGGEVTLRAAGALGAWQHLIEPQLRVEAIAPLWGAATLGKGEGARGLDERLRPRQIQQAALGLRQRFSHRGGFAAALDVAQPLDLRTRTLLQPDVGLSASLAERASIEGHLSLRPYAGRHAILRESRLSGWVQVGWARVVGGYARVAPDTDRATRSIYELSAPRRADVPSVERAERWVHSATGRVSARVNERIEASYQGSYQLPRPGAQTTRDCPANSRHCFVYHTLEARLDSACHCWGMTALVGVAPGNIAQSFRIQLGFTLGAGAENYWRGVSPASNAR